MLKLIVGLIIAGLVIFSIPGLVEVVREDPRYVIVKWMTRFLGIMTWGGGVYLFSQNHLGIPALVLLIIGTIVAIVFSQFLSKWFEFAFVPVVGTLVGVVICMAIYPTGNNFQVQQKAQAENDKAYQTSMRANESSQKAVEKQNRALAESESRAKAQSIAQAKADPMSQLTTLYRGNDVKNKRNLEFAKQTIGTKVTPLHGIDTLSGDAITTNQNSSAVYIFLASNSPYTKQAIDATQAVMKSFPDSQLFQLYPVDGNKEDVKALYSWKFKGKTGLDYTDKEASKKNMKRVLGSVIVGKDDPQVGAILKATKLDRVPSMMVLDPHGKVTMTDIGVFDQNTLKNAINIGLGSYADE